MRLDKYLVQYHNFSRNKAQQLIDAGLVTVGRKVIHKPSFDVTENIKITIADDRRVTWVSRSAEKLIGFLENPAFSFLQKEISWNTCLDIGASTGGFTQVLCQYNAKRIDTVDVGSNQLHDNIKNHPSVFSFENTDIRNFKSDRQYGIIVCDASFISLHKILDAILQLAHQETHIILLFKPQFEVGRENLNKKGVPKNQQSIEKSLQNFRDTLKQKSCHIMAEQESTLIGESGNQEYIFYIRKAEK